MISVAGAFFHPGTGSVVRSVALSKPRRGYSALIFFGGLFLFVRKFRTKSLRSTLLAAVAQEVVFGQSRSIQSPFREPVLASLRSVLQKLTWPAPNDSATDDLCKLSCPLPCSEPCPLLSLAIGTRARILRLGCPHADSSRLRTLGVFEGACIRIVDRRHGVLLDVCGSRLALDRAIAMNIVASPIAA